MESRTAVTSALCRSKRTSTIQDPTAKIHIQRRHTATFDPEVTSIARSVELSWVEPGTEVDTTKSFSSEKEALMKTGGFKQVFGLPLVDLPTLYELAMAGRFIFIPEILGNWRNYATQVTKTYPAEMTEGFYKMAKLFLESSEAEMLKTENKRLDHYYRGRLVIARARSGRYKLIRREYSSARKDYSKAIFGYGMSEPVWKLRAVVGWFFSLFHLDVEGLARVLGKRSYTEK